MQKHILETTVLLPTGTAQSTLRTPSPWGHGLNPLKDPAYGVPIVCGGLAGAQQGVTEPSICP